VDDFFLDASTNLKEREIFLIEPVSTLLNLVCNSKPLSHNYFHNIVEGDFTFYINLRKLQTIHELIGQIKRDFVLCVLTEKHRPHWTSYINA